MNEENKEQKLDLRDFLAALKRRRKAACIAAVSCVLATLLLVLFLPAHYRSTGTILIEQQEVPVELVRSTVTSYADQRVQVISQRVMTTQNLLDIIRRNDLYTRQRKRDSREDLIERMREDIAFNMISADVIDPRSGLPRSATMAFSVSYTSRSPEQAVRVANELTTLYLNENLTERTRLAQDAAGFLEEESGRLNDTIGELEAKLAEFKSKHVDELPELQNLNLQLLDRTEQDVRHAETRLMSLDQQRVFLEAQLAQLKPNSMLTSDSGERILSPSDRLKMLKSQLASARALYSANHPDIARLEREIRGLESDAGGSAGASGTNDLLRELETARGELSQARERYSSDHPDVQRLERRVASLETALQAEPQAASAPRGADVPDNPAYIQIKSQLEAANNDRRALEVQMRALRGQLAAYQRKVSVSPQIEKEYRHLTRDYESAQLKYQEVRSKLMEAQLSQNLEAERKGERFTLIEPPLPPEDPVSPNRRLILALGFILTIGMTFAIVALLERLDTSVRGRRDLENLLAVPPLAVLPWIETTVDLALRVRRRRYVLAGAAACMLLSAALIHLFYRPLDVLWLVALRRLGV